MVRRRCNIWTKLLTKALVLGISEALTFWPDMLGLPRGQRTPAHEATKMYELVSGAYLPGAVVRHAGPNAGHARKVLAEWVDMVRWFALQMAGR